MQISVHLVRQLVAAQFPQWAGLPITSVEVDGWDNRSFRLGQEMIVRLPSAEGYAAQVVKEQEWLPRLAPHLPLPIPVPLAMGRPTADFLWPWSIYRWLDGEIATVGRIASLPEFAGALARFLIALQRIDATGGPPPGTHNFYRGGSLAIYDGESRQAIDALEGKIDTAAATVVWEAAMAATWQGASVWVHGDVASGNLLVKDGRLSAVIDFGCSAVGDPACDLTIAWTFLSGLGREQLRSAFPANESTWARARGWALWKAMKTVAENMNSDTEKAMRAQCIIADVIDEHNLYRTRRSSVSPRDTGSNPPEYFH